MSGASFRCSMCQSVFVDHPAIWCDKCNEAFKAQLVDKPPVAKDEIKNPNHYTQGKIQVWDFITDQEFDFLSGNVIKYLCRYRHKGAPLKDLHKAKAYLERLIKEVENETSNP